MSRPPTTEEQQRVVRFAHALRAVPHREHCERSLGNHKCSCDVGGPLAVVYNQFLEAMGLQ